MPESKISIFIGGSTEAEDITNNITRKFRELAVDPAYKIKNLKFDVTPWNKTSNWRNGDTTHESLLRIIEEYDFAVLLWVGDDKLNKRGDENLVPRDNLIYEAGLFTGKLGKDKTFIIQNSAEKIHIPTDLLGVITKKFHWEKSSGDKSSEQNLEDELEKVCQEILSDIRKKWKAVSENKAAALKEYDNPLLESIVATAQADLAEGLAKLPSSCEFPASEYPFHLISLQDKFKDNITVRALALIDQQEKFWQSHYGDRIVASTSKKSQRIFAFANEGDFTKNFPHLQRHIKTYEIRIIDSDKLVFYGMPKKDFAIIELTGAESSHKVVAEYNRETRFDRIIFETEVEEIQKHEVLFDRIWRGSVEVRDTTSKEELADRVFNRLVAYPLKTVEMSMYIPIDEYDKHELEHPFFEEMMEKMIEIFDYNQKRNKWSEKVVEFGAGTGHFTIRLAQRFPRIKIEAIEIDWHCYKQLEIKIKKQNLKNIKPLHEDSRSYDPGGNAGKYKYIFSSFSEHHIKDLDKPLYLENIRKNLEKGGRFIVGDEFLPSHDRNDKIERRKALESYHNFIIQEAETNGHPEVAELERKALQSGIDVDEGKGINGGDFKLSCEQYEEYLRKANLTVADRQLISPKDKEAAFGGIYVYEIVASN